MVPQPEFKSPTTPGRNGVRREVDELVVLVRLHLYNRGLPCGPKAIRRNLDELHAISPLPSERTIARVLAREGLTHGRTGWYAGEEWCGKWSNPTMKEDNDN